MAGSYREARQFDRLAIREPAVILLLGHRFRGVVTRIGGGGVYVETSAPAEAGDNILIRMKLPCFEQAMVFKGEIRYAMTAKTLASGNQVNPGFGVMFQDLDPAIQRQIVEYVADSGEVLFELGGMLDRDPHDLDHLQRVVDAVEDGDIGTLGELRQHLRDIATD